jgi:hypothetical protein
MDGIVSRYLTIALSHYRTSVYLPSIALSAAPGGHKGRPYV